ncbi:MAG TPA: M20/M25/M40 family metallo-hydrolase [Candidatus Saccharimonadales bacterium]|nr:M20/M25/M40 family metallo-hydrolase [Candidatus Saccharimonadales bacterium]
MAGTALRPAARERALAALLTALIRFRSDRPEDRRPIADWAADLLQGLGGRVRRYGPPDAPALLARFPARGAAGGGVLFSGHLDTVPATGKWRTRPGQRRGGRVYGRGSADMKGGVAAVLAAASELAGRVPFWVALTTDEETGMRGARALLRVPELRRAAAVVVAEPTALRVGLAEKAIHQFRLVTAGRSAHASMPWTGVSATARMLDLLAALRRAFPSRERAGITFNVGRLDGGTRPNLVPDRCEALLDFRVPGATSPARHEARVRQSLRRTRVPHRLERLHFVTALAQDARHPLLREFERVSRRPRTPVYFATEAAVFAALGRPVVIFGPGAQEACHVTDEWVSLAQVSAAARVCRDFALRLGGAR